MEFFYQNILVGGPGFCVPVFCVRSYIVRHINTKHKLKPESYARQLDRAIRKTRPISLHWNLLTRFEDLQKKRKNYFEVKRNLVEVHVKHVGVGPGVFSMH